MPNDASPDFFVPRKLGACSSTANKVNKGEQSPDLILDDQRVLDALKEFRDGLPQDATPEDLLALETEMKCASRQVDVWESAKAEAEKTLKKLEADSASLRRVMEGRKGIEKRAISEALDNLGKTEALAKKEVSNCSWQATIFRETIALAKSSYEYKKGIIGETKECQQSISCLEERIHSKRAKV